LSPQGDLGQSHHDDAGDDHEIGSESVGFGRHGAIIALFGRRAAILSRSRQLQTPEIPTTASLLSVERKPSQVVQKRSDHQPMFAAELRQDSIDFGGGDVATRP
jgi:hypothetical protein